MSWETVNIKKIKCPCSNGFIEQRIKNDDWNRIKKQMPVINCNVCSIKYKIESKYFCPKPKHEYTLYYCVNRENSEDIIKLDL